MKKIQYTEYPNHYNADLEDQIKSQIKSVGQFIKIIGKKLLTRDDINLHYNLGTIGDNYISIDGDIFIDKEDGRYQFTIDIRKTDNSINSKLYYGALYKTNNLKDLLEELKKHLDIISIDM